MNPARNNRQRVNLIDFNPEEEPHIKEYPLPDPSIDKIKWPQHVQYWNPCLWRTKRNSPKRWE
jgi:hypothetical protein